VPEIYTKARSALQWVADNHALHNIIAVDISFAFSNYNQDTDDPALRAPLQELADADVLVVAPSGNGFKTWQTISPPLDQGVSGPGVGYPAADPRVIAVGATWDKDESGPWDLDLAGITATDNTTAPDRVTSFAQRHPVQLDIMAPGARITSGWLDGQTMPRNGTRQAAAHVTAAAALAQHQRIASGTVRLTQGEFVTLLKDTGVQVTDGDDEQDNVENTGLTFKRLNVLGMGYKLFKPAALDLKNTSDWGFSETDNKTYDTTPTLIGTVPKDAYVWIYNNTTVID
jgi:hypothetical protein